MRPLSDTPGFEPLILRAWKAKAVCAAGVLAYYIVGYFTLNRLPLQAYHDVLKVPFFDDLPIVPWTTVVYNSVFLLGGLGIGLLPDARAVKRYFVSVVLAYTLNYVFFALYPTRIVQDPLPDSGSMWLWALRLTRIVDGPYTCFPSLHLTNCTLVVIGHWYTRYGRWFLLWTLAIAVSTLTTDQHLFLDLPAGAVVAGLGAFLASKVSGAHRD